LSQLLWDGEWGPISHWKKGGVSAQTGEVSGHREMLGWSVGVVE